MVLPVIMATGTLPKRNSSDPPGSNRRDAAQALFANEMLRIVKKVLREADSTTDAPTVMQS